jgi:hypothetical protein
MSRDVQGINCYACASTRIARAIAEGKWPMSWIPKIAVALLVLGSATAADAACERHIYNNTDYRWFIEYVPGGVSSSTGSLYFGDFCGNVRNGSCWLPPHSVMTITYTTTAGMTAVNLGVKDPTNYEKIFYAYSTGSTCPKLQHDGSTGGASVNDPADGDVTISSYAWDTSIMPPVMPNGGGGPPDTGMHTKPMPAPPPPTDMGKARAD